MPCLTHVLPWQTTMEEVRAVDDAVVLEQRHKEGGGVDWVALLQSPRVAAELKEDIVRVVQQGAHYAGHAQSNGVKPDTLAFLEDLAQTLRVER
jgi:hypothetical protein